MVYIDRTGAFNGDVIAVTSTGRIWSVKNSGKASQVATLGTGLEGVVVIADDADVYGPGAAKVIAGAKNEGAIYSVNTQGTATSHSFGGSVIDLRIVPAHQNFYGVDATSQKIWGAPASFFSNKIGDVLIEEDGTLSNARWNGEQFEVAEVAQVSSWKQQVLPLYLALSRCTSRLDRTSRPGDQQRPHEVVIGEAILFASREDRNYFRGIKLLDHLFGTIAKLIASAQIRKAFEHEKTAFVVAC